VGITDVVRGARRTLAGLQPHRVGQEEDERRLVQLHIDLVVNDDGVRGNAGEATDLRGPTQDAYDAYLDAVRRRRAWFTLAGTASFLIASVAGYLVLGEVRDVDASVFRDPAATEQYLLTSGLVGIGVVLLGTAGVLLVLGSTKATWFVVAGVSWTLFAAVSPFVWLSVDPAFALAAVASIVVFAGVGALLMSVSAVVVQSLFRMGLRHAVITSLGDCLALALYGSVLRAHMPYDQVGEGPGVYTVTRVATPLSPYVRTSLAAELERAAHTVVRESRGTSPGNAPIVAEAVRDYALRVAGAFAGLAGATVIGGAGVDDRVRASLIAGYTAACQGRWDELARAEPVAWRDSRTRALVTRGVTVAALVVAALVVTPRVLTGSTSDDVRNILLGASLLALTDPRGALLSVRDSFRTGLADR